MSGNYKGLNVTGSIFFSLCNIMYRTVSVLLNSTNILAQEQFGSGGLADIKILYNFMDDILWVLNDERHCSGFHCDLVRHFWQWIITVGSKLDGYGYESNSGLHFFIYVLRGETVSLTPNPQPGGPGYPFWSGSPPLNYLARDAIPVASLLPAQLSGSFDHTSPTTASK